MTDSKTTYCSKQRAIASQLIWLLLVCSVCFNTSYAQTRAMIQTKTNLKQLETKINLLQHTLNSAQDKQGILNQELGHTQKQINEGLTELKKIHQDLAIKQSKINALQQRVDSLSEQLHIQQHLLAKHICVRYKSGEYQPVKWLLNQDNPQDINRLLTFYQYLVRSRQHSIDRVIATQKNLIQSQRQLNQDLIAQQQLQQQLNKRQQQFDHNKRYHTVLIHELKQDIQNKQQTLKAYRQNRANLTHLLTVLVQQSVIQTRHPFTQQRKKLISPVQTGRNNIKKINQGLLFYAQEGSPVVSVYPGKVVFCDWLNGYGRLLIIDHGWGFMTLYANNQSLFKRKGDTVNQGEQIASVGHSGTLKENGLYFEIRHRGKATPPLDWMS